MIKIIKENILGIAAVVFLLNGMAIIYMIRFYMSPLVVRFALAVGILDSLLAFILLVVIGVKFAKQLLNADES